MMVNPRLIGVVSCGLALSLAVSVTSLWAQNSRPDNPLRRTTAASADTQRTSKALANSFNTAGKKATTTSSTFDHAKAATYEPVAAVQQASHVEEVTEPTSAASAPKKVVRQTAYGIHGPTHQRRSYTSTRPTVNTSVLEHSTIVGESIVIDEGELIPEPFLHHGKGDIVFEGTKGVPVFADGDCSSCSGGGCGSCCLIPCPRLSLDNLEVFGGVQGFTGPKNLGLTGSFGFHYGANWGAPMPCLGGCLGIQFGASGVHSNFSGTAFTDSSRDQLFLTGGIFRRVDWGLQGGLVVDYLADNWYTDTELVQLRGEFSWVFPCAHELGFWFASSDEMDTARAVFTGSQAAQDLTWEPTDLYAFFYRHRWGGFDGASSRIFAGWTGDDDGLIGADLRIPLSCSWALETGFSYLVPEEATTGLSGGGHEQESWNIAITMVWYPGSRSAYGNDYFRPLLPVANNGTFMVDRR